MSKATRFVLKNVRLSYPALDKPRPGMTGGEEKYSANLIIDKSDAANIKMLRDNLIAALNEKFPDRTKLPAILRNNDLTIYLSSAGKDGWPLRDGNFVDKDGYENTVFVRAANRMAPFTIDAANRLTSPKTFYAGCYVDAALEAYGWENTSSNTKGVSITLHGVKFAGEGDSFGAAPVSSSEFFGEAEVSDADDPSSYNL